MARVTTALGAAVLAGTAACSSKSPTALSASAALPDSAEQVMYGLKNQQTTGGVRKSVLYADTAYFYNDNTLVDLRRVRLVFFSSTGDSNGVMVGRTGHYDTRTQRVEGRGDVVVTSTDGRRLTSPHLVYERSVNQISSDTSFTFNEPGRTLEGIGFRSDPQLRNVQVLKGARGRTVVPPQSESPAGARASAAGAPAAPPGAPTTTPVGVHPVPGATPNPVAPLAPPAASAASKAP